MAQAQLLIRANDPLYELMMPLGLHRLEDRTWQRTLHNLAARFGATDRSRPASSAWTRSGSGAGTRTSDTTPSSSPRSTPSRPARRKPASHERWRGGRFE